MDPGEGTHPGNVTEGSEASLPQGPGGPSPPGSPRGQTWAELGRGGEDTNLLASNVLRELQEAGARPLLLRQATGFPDRSGHQAAIHQLRAPTQEAVTAVTIMGADGVACGPVNIGRGRQREEGSAPWGGVCERREEGGGGEGVEWRGLGPCGGYATRKSFLENKSESRQLVWHGLFKLERWSEAT